MARSSFIHYHTNKSHRSCALRKTALRVGQILQLGTPPVTREQVCTYTALHHSSCLCSLFGGSDYKLIYRHYATLYFVFCVDSSESELGILDLIQVFVETLDKCFENVCELDLIFHMDKVHHILQEVVIGGMVLETNMNEIVAQVEAQSKLEKAEGGLSAAPSRAVSAVKNINLPEIPRNINIGDINIKVPNLSQFM
ncbi:PREDICTED: AP-3 complex subunit sigma-2-like [Pygoscelis adeliae]|uniref:AP-3 complex subunit sigma-2-like n=1 Tax=Pygoscelis adeliae TaxID=9238 RepID=UPI0004F4D6B9|nr:PREDICTED: AP-3 complex subunit sigma-2-like [Pygoscelis adeliae]